MTRFQNVLVPIDLVSAGPDGLTAETEAALEQARWIAEADGARVTLMSVVPEAEREVLELVEHRLGEIGAARLRKSTVDVAATAGSGGKVFVDIVRKVLRDGHDLVVVGPRDAHRKHPGIVGSNALRLLRKCPCPVWIASRPGSGKPRTVLSAVALHPTTPSILKLSAAVCTSAQAAWHVLHVPEYPHEGGMRLRGVPREELEAYKREVREGCWKQLHAAVDPVAQKAGVEPKLWMSEGLPSEQIEQAAGELSADVVVMATVARHGLAGMLLGSTADKVFSRLDVSLLVIKPEDYVSPITLEG